MSALTKWGLEKNSYSLLVPFANSEYGSCNKINALDKINMYRPEDTMLLSNRQRNEKGI